MCFLYHSKFHAIVSLSHLPYGLEFGFQADCDCRTRIARQSSREKSNLSAQTYSHPEQNVASKSYPLSMFSPCTDQEKQCASSLVSFVSESNYERKSFQGLENFKGPFRIQCFTF